MLDVMPISVIMRRKTVPFHWGEERIWAAAAVVPEGTLPPLHLQQQDATHENVLIPGLKLELHRDETYGYFENWVAPAPKVFVMWRVQQDQALPVKVSVSYDEGARMLDSGEQANGVAMAPEIHAWLAGYLQQHYQSPGQPLRETREEREQRRKAQQPLSRFA